MRTRIAVVGCGHWGQNLVRNFDQLSALQVICDASEHGRSLAAQVAPACPVTQDFDEVLQSDIDGVVIATPAETHYGIARKALLARKDVFVEKPLALQYEEGSDLLRIADLHSRILMVGHVLEYHPGICKIRELICRGELGKIQYIYSNRLSLGKIRREENILWSFAPHDIAIVLRLVGSMPFEITACGGAYLQPNIPDVTITNLLFDNGVRAHIHVSWLHPFKEQRLVVIGSRKMVSFDDVNKTLILHDQRVEINNGGINAIKGEGELVNYGTEEPLRLECQAFLSAIVSRVAPLTEGSSGLRVLKVLQAAQRSLVTNGQPVRLPLEAYAHA